MQPDQIIRAVDLFKYVFEFLKEIKKRSRNLFGSKRTEIMERKFKEALIGTKNAIEASIWYGKGFAIQAECGVKVDKSFHVLMGLLINKFNDIQMRIDPEKLDEKLIDT